MKMQNSYIYGLKTKHSSYTMTSRIKDAFLIFVSAVLCMYFFAVVMSLFYQYADSADPIHNRRPEPQLGQSAQQEKLHMRA